MGKPEATRPARKALGPGMGITCTAWSDIESSCACHCMCTPRLSRLEHLTSLAKALTMQTKVGLPTWLKARPRCEVMTLIALPHAPLTGSAPCYWSDDLQIRLCTTGLASGHTLIPADTASATKDAPGSFTSGSPASLTIATAWPLRSSCMTCWQQQQDVLLMYHHCWCLWLASGMQRTQVQARCCAKVDRHLGGCALSLFKVWSRPGEMLCPPAPGGCARCGGGS